jgi:hypothetical protein
MQLFSFFSLFLFLATLALNSSAVPKEAGDTKQTLNIFSRFDSNGFTRIVDADQARARYLKSASSGLTPRAQATNFQSTATFSVSPLSPFLS